MLEVITCIFCVCTQEYTAGSVGNIYSDAASICIYMYVCMYDFSLCRQHEYVCNSVHANKREYT